MNIGFSKFQYVLVASQVPVESSFATCAQAQTPKNGRVRPLLSGRLRHHHHGAWGFPLMINPETVG